MKALVDRITPYLPLSARLALARRDEAASGQRRLANPEELSRLVGRLNGCERFDDFLEFAEEEFDLNQKPSEIRALIGALKEREPVVVGEIGSYRCGNLFLLGHTVESIRRIVAVDQIFRQREVLLAIESSDRRYAFIEGNSRSRRTLATVRKELGRDRLDFLFIDGDHTYKGVKADFLNFRDLVREGGLIAFHDIVPDLTTRMKSKVRLSKCYSGGVPLFWSEVKQSYPYSEFIEDRNQDAFGIGIIEYSRATRARLESTPAHGMNLGDRRTS